jgi:hypothetical protein
MIARNWLPGIAVHLDARRNLDREGQRQLLELRAHARDDLVGRFRRNKSIRSRLLRCTGDIGVGSDSTVGRCGGHVRSTPARYRMLHRGLRRFGPAQQRKSYVLASKRSIDSVEAFKCERTILASKPFPRAMALKLLTEALNTDSSSAGSNSRCASDCCLA